MGKRLQGYHLSWLETLKTSSPLELANVKNRKKRTNTNGDIVT